MQTNPQRTSDQMFPVIRQYMSTDMSQRQFCEKHQIELHLFRYWLKKYREEKQKKEGSTFSSLALALPTTKDCIVIRTEGGVEIEVPI